MAEVMVLCYHAFSPSWDAPFSVQPDTLERQLASLIRHGWRGATFSQAVFDPPASRTVAVTFDDAFASVLEWAHPILSALGLPGTVFAPTAFMSHRQQLRWPGLEQWSDGAGTHELQSMSWKDLGTLTECGWEIGSHSRTHPRLTQLDQAELREELGQSRAELAANLGRPCEICAYPYGDVDVRVAEEARTAGYVAGAALASRLTPSEPYRWPRIGVNHLDRMWRFRLKVDPSVRRLRASRLWPT